METMSEEGRRVLYEFNNTTMAFSLESVVHELFEQQVSHAPNALAVVHDGQGITYAGLNRRANHLARFLRDRGIGPDRSVGICYERCPELIVAVVGVLKAGGAFLPLDPSYHDDRLSYILADASPSLILAQEHMKARLGGAAEVISCAQT